MHKCSIWAMGSFFRVKRNVILNLHHIGSKPCQDILHFHLCCGPTNSKPLDLNTANLWNTKIEKTHRSFSSDSLVPSFGQKFKRGEKPGKRIKIAENGRVYGNFRSNLGVEKSNWDDLQPGGYGVSNDVVFGHLDEFVRDQGSINLSSGAWEDLKEDLEGFPFNGRTLNRTNIDSCILQYLRHTSNLNLAASFSSYLRNNGGLQPLHHKQLLLLYTDAHNIDQADDEVKQLSQSILDDGPTSGSEEIYWLAVQAMARTSAWKVALESALKEVDTNTCDAVNASTQRNADPLNHENRGSQSQGSTKSLENSLGAFSILIQQALEVGDSALALRLMHFPDFHRHLVPLRQNLQRKHQEHLDNVIIAWLKHCSKKDDKLETEAELVKLVEYMGERGLMVNEAVEEALFKFCQDDQSLDLAVRKVTITQKGHCTVTGTALPSQWQENKKFHLLHNQVLEVVLQGKDVYQSTNPQELKQFLDMVDNEGPFDVVIDGLNIALSSTPGRYKDMQSRGQPGRLESLQVLNVVDYFCDAGLKVLVVTRRRAKFYRDFHQICKRARVHLLDKVTEDDPFTILAALQSGPTCLIVTNDLLRQHFYLLWRLDPELGKLFTEWQVGHQVKVPAHRAYTRNMPPEKIHFTDPVIVNPPRHALTASHTPPFFHLPLTPSREGDVLTSLPLPSHWICLGPRQSDLSENDKRHLKSKLKQSETLLPSLLITDKDEAKVNNTLHMESEGPSNSWPFRDHDWPSVKSRGKPTAGRRSKTFSDRNSEPEVDTDEWEGQKSHTKEQKRSWSRAGGRKEGRQSWPFEGGDWPEVEEERENWTGGKSKKANSGKRGDRFEAEDEVIGGSVEADAAHWSQRKLPDPPKVQFQDQVKKKRPIHRKGTTDGYVKKMVLDPVPRK